MWMYDTEGLGDGCIMKYKPSVAHAHDARWCFTYDDAMLYGLNKIKVDQFANLYAMPTFVIKVIKSRTKPDWTENSRLRLYVRRIPLT